MIPTLFVIGWVTENGSSCLAAMTAAGNRLTEPIEGVGEWSLDDS